MRLSQRVDLLLQLGEGGCSISGHGEGNRGKAENRRSAGPVKESLSVPKHRVQTVLMLHAR